MSERIVDSRLEGGLRAPPGLSLPRKAWWWFHLVVLVNLARMRFLAILALVGLVLVKWDTINGYWEKWTRPAPPEQASAAGTEYYCAMHPQIVRDHPDKCPICGMPLSERKKGSEAEDEQTPAGVVRRVNLSPYRVAQANLQTWEVGYRPLTRQIEAAGSVEFDERKLARISNRITGLSRIDKLLVNFTGQMVERGQPLALLYSPELIETVQNLRLAKSARNAELERMARDRLRLWGIGEDEVKDVLHTDAARGLTHFVIRSPIHGHVIRKYPVEGEYVKEGDRLYDVADLSTVWIEGQVYEDDVAFLKDAAAQRLAVEATVKTFPGRVFRGHVAFVHPHLDASTRTLRVRFDLANRDHELRPGMYGTVKLAVPATRLELFARAERTAWVNATAADGLGHALAAPLGHEAGGGLAPLLQTAAAAALREQGLVLAVPESAVIDTGSRQFVYRQAWPGVYDCLEVQLGPRSGDFYPVVGGLEAGHRVVTAGSFLLDADTRLSGGIAASWLGANAGPGSSPVRRPGTVQPSVGDDEDTIVQANLAKLSRGDRRLAEAQGLCPIRGTRLGTMGPPIKVVLKAQPVFLCCKGCEREARANPERTLGEVARLKAAREASPSNTPFNVSAGSRSARIKVALAKLAPEDQRLAAAQRFCVVEQKNRLGAMGTPVKVTVLGQTLFLCCEGCEPEVLARPEQALSVLRKMKVETATSP
jgi:Cu(I)/Ag(I) efflux system membrane fusion protein